MVGNDVVDLRDPETGAGARHPRFDTRVFDGCERAALEASTAPDRLRWTLWAAKEAAYKLCRKLDPATVFSPVRFGVRLDGMDRGVVRHGAHAVHVRVTGGPGLVHAVAATRAPGGARIVSGIRELRGVDRDGADGASRAVRALALRFLTPRIGAPERQLAIARIERVPVLLRCGAPQPLDLSLSHHGRWIGFACDLAPEANGGARDP